MVQSSAASLLQVQTRWRSGAGYWYRGTSVQKETELTLAASRVLDAGALPEAFDRELLAATEAMADEGTILPAVVERFGVAAAFLVKLRALDYGATSFTLDKQSHHVVALRANQSVTEPAHARLPPLRALLCAADDESYAAAHAEAVRALAQLGPMHRVAIAFLFPEEPKWAETELRAALGAMPQRMNHHTFGILFGSIDDPALLRQWIGKAQNWAAWFTAPYVADALLRLRPEDSVELVSLLVGRSIDHRKTLPQELESLGVALLALPFEKSARTLAPLLLHPGYGRWARDWFRTHRAFAHVLDDQARQKTVLGDVARRILRSMDPRPAAQPIPELPAWLTMTPRPAAPLPNLELARPAVEGTFPWREGERERLLAAIEANDVRPMTEEMLGRWRALAVGARPVDLWAQWENGKWAYWRVPDDEGLALFNGQVSAPARHPALTMLARHGDAAFPGLFARECFDDLVRVRSPVLALICARALRSVPRRRRARRWLLEDPAMSVRGLLPFAFSALGRKKRDAESGLRLVARDHAAVIRSVAAELGDGVSAAVDAWLGRDLLALATTARAEKRTPHLPALRLRDGRFLPDAAMSRVLAALRRCAPHTLDPRLVELRELLDPASRDELAFAAFVEWAIAGATSVSAWLTFAAAWLGTAATLRRLWPFLHHWSLRSGKRAALVLDALEANGTNDALTLVARVAEGRMAAPLRSVALEILEEAATRQGITGLELRDRIAPTFDADASGAITFDLGARTFRLSLGDDLGPALVAADGRRFTQLPRPSKDDDPTKAEHAAERWRWVSTEAKVAAQLQTVRLERAMTSGQRWTNDAFRHLLRHPFLSLLARRLVWSTPETTFRIAEDGTPTSIDDRSIPLPSGDVWLPHPLDLDPALIEAWSATFADYAIVQPFEQLGRAIFTMPAPMLAGTRIDSTNGRIVPARRVVAILDAMGWASGRVSLRKKDGGAAYAYLAATPGHTLRRLSDEKTQTLGVITLYSAKSFAEIVDVDLSELLRAADALR